MLNKLLSMVRTYDMVHSGDTVVCAVSGGADSVALLYAMFLLRTKLQINLQAAHYNHNLRGEESVRDQQFVQALCHRLDIPLHLGSSQVTAGKKGLEAAAREARYAFFETLPGKIATAHTADDNAETVLMHLMRGTGLKGLGAISPIRGKVIRPMLTVTRQQVLAFLAEQQLDYVEDSSNREDVFLRNRIRHRVMPLLKEENPRLCENLSAMALRLRADEQALQEMMEFSQGLSVAALRQMPAARCSRVLAAFLQHCGVSEPEAHHVDLLQSLVFSQNPSARANFPGNICIGRCYDRLDIMMPQAALPAVTLQCLGVTNAADWGVQIICSMAEKIVNDAHCFTVAPQGQLVLRSRLPGDEIRLHGGRKSLKKLFVDRKIPAAARNCVPVLADEAGVLAVDGIGVHLDRCAESLPAVQIRIEPLKSGNMPQEK